MWKFLKYILLTLTGLCKLVLKWGEAYYYHNIFYFKNCFACFIGQVTVLDLVAGCLKKQSIYFIGRELKSSIHVKDFHAVFYHLP